MVETLQSYQEIIRVWKKHMTAHEYIVLLELADHTWGWGKPSDAISTGKLLNGNSMYAGLGHMMGRASVFRALIGLEEKGFIERNSKPRATTRYKVNKKWSEGMLNLPKRLKNGSHPETVGSHPETSQVSQGDTIEGNSLEGNSEKVTPAASATPRSAPSPDELVRTAKAAHMQTLSARRNNRGAEG